MKIGIIGAGAVVESYHLPVLSRIADVKVSFVCDASLDRAQKVAGRFRIPVAVQGMADCPDVDVTLVAVPVGVREGVVPNALMRGWHVFCEKPFAISTAQHERFLVRARAAHRAIGVGLMRRYYAATHTATSIVASGMFGRVQEVWAGEGGRARGVGRPAGWYQEHRAMAGGGALIETGSHLVDQVFSILGVAAFELSRYEQIVLGDVEFDARAEVTLQLSNGDRVPARFAISKLLDVHNGIVIRFEHAEVRLESAPTSTVTITHRGSRGKPVSIAPTGGTQSVFGAFRQEWLDFLTQCRTGETSPVDAASTLLFTCFMDECYRHAGTPNEPIKMVEATG